MTVILNDPGGSVPFPSEEAAYLAYVEKAKILHGKFYNAG
jgi:hypothetical protein